MRPGLAQRIEAWWDSKPLSAQLVTLITLLLAIGLSLSGTVMIGLLQRHLTSQIDDQLIATAHTIQISASSATFAADGQGGIPTLYYVHIRDAKRGRPLLLLRGHPQGLGQAPAARTRRHELRARLILPYHPGHRLLFQGRPRLARPRRPPCMTRTPASSPDT